MIYDLRFMICGSRHGVQKASRWKNHKSRPLQNALPVAQTSKSAVSRISKSADLPELSRLPTWKSATQQVWKPALRGFAEVSNHQS
jgi:hypothetical protein